MSVGEFLLGGKMSMPSDDDDYIQASPGGFQKFPHYEFLMEGSGFLDTNHLCLLWLRECGCMHV